MDSKPPRNQSQKNFASTESFSEDDKVHHDKPISLPSFSSKGRKIFQLAEPTIDLSSVSRQNSIINAVPKNPYLDSLIQTANSHCQSNKPLLKSIAPIPIQPSSTISSSTSSSSAINDNTSLDNDNDEPHKHRHLPFYSATSAPPNDLPILESNPKNLIDNNRSIGYSYTTNHHYNYTDNNNNNNSNNSSNSNSSSNTLQTEPPPSSHYQSPLHEYPSHLSLDMDNPYRSGNSPDLTNFADRIPQHIDPVPINKSFWKRKNRVETIQREPESKQPSPTLSLLSFKKKLSPTSQMSHSKSPPEVIPRKLIRRDRNKLSPSTTPNYYYTQHTLESDSVSVLPSSTGLDPLSDYISPNTCNDQPHQLYTHSQPGSYSTINSQLSNDNDNNNNKSQFPEFDLNNVQKIEMRTPDPNYVSDEDSLDENEHIVPPLDQHQQQTAPPSSIRYKTITIAKPKQLPNIIPLDTSQLYNYLLEEQIRKDNQSQPPPKPAFFEEQNPKQLYSAASSSYSYVHKTPSAWQTYCNVLTCWIPKFVLEWSGMKTKPRQQAWREKIGLISIIFLLINFVGFFTFAFNAFVCGQPIPRIHYKEIPSDSVVIHGSVYNISTVYHSAKASFIGPQYRRPKKENNSTSSKIPPHPLSFLNIWNFAGSSDASLLFQNVNGACSDFISADENLTLDKNARLYVPMDRHHNNAFSNYYPCFLLNLNGSPRRLPHGYPMNEQVTNHGLPGAPAYDRDHCHLKEGYRNYLYRLQREIDVYYLWSDLPDIDNDLVVYLGDVIDLTRLSMLRNLKLSEPLLSLMKNSTALRETDISFILSQDHTSRKAATCLCQLAKVGVIDTDSVGCITSNIVLIISLIFIVSIIVVKFVFALYFEWFLSWRLGINFQHMPLANATASITSLAINASKVAARFEKMMARFKYGAAADPKKFQKGYQVKSRYPTSHAHQNNTTSQVTLENKMANDLTFDDVILGPTNTNITENTQHFQQYQSDLNVSLQNNRVETGVCLPTSTRHPNETIDSEDDNFQKAKELYYKDSNNLDTIMDRANSYSNLYQQKVERGSSINTKVDDDDDDEVKSNKVKNENSPEYINPEITTTLPDILEYNFQQKQNNPEASTKSQHLLSSDQLIHTICLVTAYSESEGGLRGTFDSIATSNYPNSHKLIIAVCDGDIAGEDSIKTPDIVMSMMEDYLTPPELSHPLPYVAIGQGAKRLNFAMVVGGFYKYDNNTVEVSQQRSIPMICIKKCGDEWEKNTPKPGNRGKRDSQVLLMRFLQKIIFSERMTDLENALYYTIWQLTGIDAIQYETMLMVDADTTIMPDSVEHMVSCFVKDPMIMGLCGETEIANKTESWVTMIQVFEYFISHHLTKSFESVFGGVTCLPGCFSMYRIKAPKGNRHHFYWVPILANPDIVERYGITTVETLHEKNLLLLGEDRYLSTLMLKTFPNRKQIFVPQAKCKTVAPSDFGVLLDQRRRWINSTVHNLMELIIVRDLCGVFCISMQFVVLIEFIGTLTLPAALLFTIFVIFRAIVERPVPVLPLVLMGFIIGIPGLLIVVTAHRWSHVLWMTIYLISLPVWNFILPLNACKFFFYIFLLVPTY